MQRKALILTHNGFAHADEFWAIASLIVAEELDENEYTIKRCSSPEVDIGASEVFYVDVGEQYDPNNNMFDHHQMKEGNECALSLIVKNYSVLDSLYNKNKDYSKLVDRIKIQDNEGLGILVSSMSTSPAFLRSFLKTEHVFLDWFREEPEKAVQPVVRWLKKEIDMLTTIDEVEEFINENCYQNVQEDILAIPRWSPELDKKLNQRIVLEGINSYLAEKQDKINITISVDKSRNSGCFSMFRTCTGADHYDFSQLSKSDPNIRYIHHNGFLVVFEPNVSLDTIIQDYIPKTKIIKQDDDRAEMTRFEMDGHKTW